MTKLSIKEIPFEDRPYEKFKKLGPKSLTDAELLAIVIKNGSKELNSIDISRLLLGQHENGISGFDYLKQTSLDELMKVPGIGKVKSIELKALIELSYRINNEIKAKQKIKITCSKDVYNLLKNEMEYKETEEVKVVILDNKCFVKTVATVSMGATNKSVVSPKEILSEPMKMLATSIILVHNHPSGDTTPSRQDIILTKKILDYSRIFEIELLDHIIIGKYGYTSIKEVNNDIFIGG